jgi:hypothetical protein
MASPKKTIVTSDVHMSNGGVTVGFFPHTLNT